MPTRAELQKWMGQLARRPAVTLVGRDASFASQFFSGLGCDVSAFPPDNVNSYSKVLNRAKQALEGDLILILPTLRSEEHAKFASALTGRAIDLASMDENALADALSGAIGDCPAKPSRAAAAKNRISKVNHHRPKNCEQFVEDICGLPCVSQVSYKTVQGECEVRAVGEELHVAYRQGFGLRVNLVCSHPRHVELAVQAVIGIANRWK